MDSSPSPEWVLLFDGPCALCQGAVRWLMRRDRGMRLRYSPLQGDWAQEWKRRYAPGDVWPDEVILVAGEQHWIGADAIGKCLHLLPFPYPLLGWTYAHLPGRKKIYRWLVQHRYTWFGKKDELLTTCPAPRSWHEPRPHSC
jgi:predicted DCC family thiol-disulfide oxidoreductase YuxK